ncbi:Membrane associated serine protease, rhomboid family [Chitinophaga ginsengisegetis]|uniref:Membrane associated serine protease, rhomboid family n=1 Tax=Chitinophaga ginsengisegetis TaxID=393003 RepID=A0A1T5P8Q6_9BACT|nr:rhomboid family intramembrane serine protease [Chitinophaga ginsengisegetis]MDR6567678.1 membrane associated rhomboid family serine protease [Chitinophaga ginsengisegetis]MDR6647767.1 membrane associated rhomboid family serine protease [Chitinophaga ginsengisegetis]MDR6654117.1 membrane associated rhomboid family serine protease [Chitinophaga ginsengisegetis]SKD08639.1 Membrane associated serine protease, rhomboid family [Chitinophaga ginsengisegetis]
MTLSISLIIIIITCLVSYTALKNYDQLDKMSLQPYMVQRYKQYYRFITSGFVHADFQHLIFNMLTLFFFGPAIENLFMQLFHSKLVYILYYILGIIVANIPSYIKHRNNSSYSSLGASGAISAVVFTAIMIDPWNTIFLFFIPIPAVIYGVLFLALSAYMSRKGGDNINHDAHMWGALFGIVFPLIFHPELGAYFLEALRHPRFGR